MTLDSARSLITATLARMAVLYGRPVFDEWVVISLGAESGILAYAGPRAESFRKNFAGDVAPLRAAMEEKNYEIGDFEFVADSAGPRHDASLRLGGGSYLVCNHTEKSMTEIRADPRWLKAQAAFFELAEKFRADPLVI